VHSRLYSSAFTRQRSAGSHDHARSWIRSKSAKSSHQTRSRGEASIEYCFRLCRNRHPTIGVSLLAACSPTGRRRTWLRCSADLERPRVPTADLRALVGKLHRSGLKTRKAAEAGEQTDRRLATDKDEDAVGGQCLEDRSQRCSDDVLCGESARRHGSQLEWSLDCGLQLRHQVLQLFD